MSLKEKIYWAYTGKADFLVGADATISERTLAFLAGALGVSLYLFMYFHNSFEWKAWQYFVAGILAFDVAGGVVANSLNSCKRFYHSPIKPGDPRFSSLAKKPRAFSALHVHPLVIAVIFGSGTNDVIEGAVWYGLLLSATEIVMRSPTYLKRPVSFLMILIALLINQYILEPVPGFEWFMPALFLKIVYGHLVMEEPYCPDQ